MGFPTWLGSTHTLLDRTTRFFPNSLDPLPSPDSSTRGVYLRIREACLQTPVCRERLAAHNVRLSDQQWKQLWDIPVHISFSPFSRDCIWKLLHYMLPTTAISYQCELSASDLCPACNIGRDTIDHAFRRCLVWQSLLKEACCLLWRVGYLCL